MRFQTLHYHNPEVKPPIVDTVHTFHDRVCTPMAAYPPRPTLLPTLITRALVLLYLRSPRAPHLNTISVKRPPAQCAQPIASRGGVCFSRTRCIPVPGRIARVDQRAWVQAFSSRRSIVISLRASRPGYRTNSIRWIDLTGSVERVFRGILPEAVRASAIIRAIDLHLQTDRHE
jgi:hypothetical protein